MATHESLQQLLAAIHRVRSTGGFTPSPVPPPTDPRAHGNLSGGGIPHVGPGFGTPNLGAHGTIGGGPIGVPGNPLDGGMQPHSFGPPHGGMAPGPPAAGVPAPDPALINRMRAQAGLPPLQGAPGTLGFGTQPGLHAIGGTPGGDGEGLQPIGAEHPVQGPPAFGPGGGGPLQPPYFHRQGAGPGPIPIPGPQMAARQALMGYA